MNFNFMCFKSVPNPSCRDLISTNNAKNFQNTISFYRFIGFSQIYLAVLKASKPVITKSKHQKITERDYKKKLPLLDPLRVKLPFHN